MIIALVAVQVTLGALTVLTQRNVWINSVHVVVGALVLATSLVISLRAWRVVLAERGLRTAESAIPARPSIRTPQSAIRNSRVRA
jgi:heme A synthase